MGPSFERSRQFFLLGTVIVILILGLTTLETSMAVLLGISYLAIITLIIYYQSSKRDKY